jgi:N-acetylglucosamine kinase-like BadF-type ATPase
MSSNHRERDQHPNAEPLFLGIDGGGTKTVAWLGRVQQDRLAQIGASQAGPSNPRAVGFETAFQNIQQAITAAFEHARLTQRVVKNACLCLAGTGRMEEQETVVGWAKRAGLAQQVRLVSEAEAVLAAVDVRASSDCAEVALICGTGSLAWGRGANHERCVRSGGWGYLLGDEGSGFWLGQQVLQSACKVADGRAPEPAVLARVLTELQLQSADQLVGWCYEQPASRDRIASLAPLAFEIDDIVDRGATELAQMVAAVVKQLDASRYTLTMSGSVLMRQPKYRRLVEERLKQQSIEPLNLQLVEHPVAGALRLAAEAP